MSKQSLLAALQAAKFPGDLVEQVEGVEGDDLTHLLAVVSKHIGDLHTKVSALSTKAELGEAYLRSLRSDALAWYVKARQTDSTQPVSTVIFNKLLDRCADDEEMLRDIIKEQQELAHAKFPPSVRRSTFEGDHNEATALADLPSADSNGTNGKFASRIHR